MAHESLPDKIFSDNDLDFIATIEQDMRPLSHLRDLDMELRKSDTELYRLIDGLAYEHSRGDVGLRELYFREFLLLSHAVKRINQQEDFPLSWAEKPPLLST